MTRIVALVFFAVSVCIYSGCEEGSKAEPIARVSNQQQRFDELLAKYPNLTYQQLTERSPQRGYLAHLAFDPAKVKFYDETVERLQLTGTEQKMLRTQGFVSVDHDQPYSFGSVYYAVYTNDLPVLVTTDSILHALHCTYDDILMELEQTYFTSALDEVLRAAHESLALRAPVPHNYKKLPGRRSVSHGRAKSSSGRRAPASANAHRGTDAWNGALFVKSQLNQDQEVQEVLNLIQSLKLQDPLQQDFTHIYGGMRSIDYSQFKPRGHYLKSVPLSRYFRAMMWLGRADTGWNVLPPDPQSGIVSDTPRELRDAVLLTDLLQSSGAINRLRQMSEILDFMVGESDNLTVFQLADLLRQQKIASPSDIASSRRVNQLQEALRKSDLGAQQIRSQVILSDPNDLYQVPPPSTFQVSGQRFAVDSFVLSKVVYDSIIFNGQKVQRKMPAGADVMFALGNDTVLPLLKDEMVTFPYAANLKASQDFVGQFQQPFWRANLYNIWLDTLRTLDTDQSSEKHCPQAIRTEAWQRKQLQTQLASWSELRHDNVLYTKQSYTAKNSCEYPTGYVEPYPETYAHIKYFAEEAARRIGAVDFRVVGPNYERVQQRQVEFFQQMAGILEKLETLSQKELAAEPFTEQDRAWLKKTIDKRGGGSGPPSYNGWYPQLFYRDGPRCA